MPVVNSLQEHELKLLDYRKLRKLSRRAAGAALGVNQITVWRWETGRTAPDAAAMRRIAKWSDGAVTANDMVGAG